MASTIHDVARVAGVGIGTVSRVINNHPGVRPATREKVLEAVAQLNYKPNPIARSMISKRTGVIGVIVSFFTRPFKTEVLRGVEAVLGVHRAFGEAGLLFEPELMLTSEWDRHGGKVAALQLLLREKRPTAIFAASDMQAVGVLEAAKDLNINVPEDLSVIGFDGIEIAELLGISTIQQPMRQMGELGVTETPYGSSRGVLGLLALSLPCDRASCKVCKTFKPTTSGVEDIRAWERNARLSSVVTLACDLRPFPHAATRGSQAREERSGMHLIETVVLLPARPIYRGTRKHYAVVKCTMDTFL